MQHADAVCGPGPGALKTISVQLHASSYYSGTPTSTTQASSEQNGFEHLCPILMGMLKLGPKLPKPRNPKAKTGNLTSSRGLHVGGLRGCIHRSAFNWVELQGASNQCFRSSSLLWPDSNCLYVPENSSGNHMQLSGALKTDIAACAACLLGQKPAN